MHPKCHPMAPQASRRPRKPADGLEKSFDRARNGLCHFLKLRELLVQPVALGEQGGAVGGRVGGAGGLIGLGEGEGFGD